MGMTRFRFGAFMTTVIYIAVGLATFRSDHRLLWESVVYTLTFILIAASSVMACCGCGRERRFWAGFALFAGAYFVVEFGRLPETDSIRPYLLTTGLLRELYENTRNIVRYRYYEAHRFLVVGHSVMAVLFGLVGAVLARSLDAGEETASDHAPPRQTSRQL